MFLVIIVSISGGFGPASQLSQTPITILKSIRGASPGGVKLGRRFALGCGMIFMSIIFSLLIRSSSTLWMGLGTPLLFLIGAIILVPPILRILLDGLLRFRDYLPIAFQLSIDHLSLTFSRSVSAVTALMISAGLFISIDLMVTSFSGSLKSWLEEVLKADIYLSRDENSNGSISGITSEMAIQLESLPGVTYVDTARTVVSEYNGRPFQVTGVSFDILRTQRRLHLIHNEIETGQIDIPHVFVSEPFARWHRVKEGDVLKLFNESQKLFVEGVYRDYSTENGVVLVEDSLFRDMFRGIPISSASLYLRQGTDVGRVMADIRDLPWEGGVLVRSEEGLRSEIFRIFKATFRVTEILMWLTLVVALWVVSNTITIMIAERSSELQTLRSIGAHRKRLVGMVSLEAALLGFFGIGGSILCGSGLALILVYIVNPFFFGWTLAPHWSWTIFLILLGGVPVLTGIVGASVAFVVFRQPIQGIKYE
jgi:putative ABC transport system permease protein